MLVKKTVDVQMLEKVFLKKKRKHSGEYSYSRLVLCLGELKSKGYFFNREWAGDKEHCIEFCHFLTKKKLFLHLKRTSYTYRKGNKLTMSLDENATYRSSGGGDGERPMLHFGKILERCGLCLREKTLHKIYDTGLSEDDSESLLTTLAKNCYVQKRVGRINNVTVGETKTYWAGEFLDEEAGPGEANYLYLVQIRTQVKDKSRNLGYMVSPEWYLMRSKEPMGEICLENGVVIPLAELEWLNRPFARYYDLPETMPRVYAGKQECFELSDENLNRVLAQLYQDGYRFRRERTYPALPDYNALIEAQTETISAELGLNKEYVRYGLNRIETEFVNEDTRERKVLIVEPAEIRLESNNGCCWINSAYTSWFRLDQGHDSTYYTGENDENDMTDQVTEIVFPEPVFLTLLKKHQLITAEQVKLCHLMACKEFRSWFYDFSIYTPCDFDGAPDVEISEQEKEKAAKVRRIARNLHYGCVGEYADNGHTKVEIYANEERSSAIFLLETGGEYRAKYVDEYMDVSGALRMHLS